MPQLTLDELEALDLRGYVTQLGFNAEANAKTFGNKIKITKIQVDGGLLPSERSPVSVENVVHDYGDESIFDAVVNEDAAGVMTAQISIPVSHAINGGSYEIWGLAVIAELDGVEFIYSYRRIEGDVKLFNSDSLKSYLFRVTWQTSNASVIEYVIAPSIAYVTHKEMGEHDESEVAHADIRSEIQLVKDSIANSSKPNRVTALEPDIIHSTLNIILIHNNFQLPAPLTDCYFDAQVDSSVDLDAGDVRFHAPANETINALGGKHLDVRIVKKEHTFKFYRLNGEWYAS